MLCFFLIVLGKNGFAQQDPMYSMYLFDKMLINPAYTGSSNWAVGTLKYRQQFIGMDGSPVTETFNFHSPVQKKHIGWGFKIINDKIAVNSNINASLFYAYHLNFAGGKLSFGLEGGIYNRKIDFTKLILNNPIDNSIPSIPMNSTVPDGSCGIYYQKKQFYAGLSDCHLLGNTFNYKTTNAPKSHLYSNLNYIMGNIFDLNEKWSFEPSMLVKYQPAAPIQADVNAMLAYKNFIAAGVQYRTGDAVAVFFKITIVENLRIAYAFDKTISGLTPYSRGANEIIISYGIKLPPPAMEKEIHPRYYF
jgi:type IX secretion system PorP/SprF family membrane protein